MTRRLRLGLLLAGAVLAGLPAGLAKRIEFSWPTPNPAWEQGRGYEAWVQPTVSGEPESGLFGCVRSNGHQFHEGLDIRPLRRDRHGEPADPVMAAMDGVVRYVNPRAGDSSYGRYIVIEHNELTPAVYTLYAHLARIEPGIKPFAVVKRGQVIGLMGHSAGGYAIPKERAHVHFEIGLIATTNFAAWYAWKRFGSPNEHGVYNGMNLMGIDPHDFLREFRQGRVDNFQEYFDRMRAVVRVRVATRTTPDFIARYPSLLRRPLPPDGLVAGWEVECNSTGLPFAWTPLGPAEVAGMAPGSVRIVSVDRAAVRAYHCKELVRLRGGQEVPDTDLAIMLQQVFGWR
ncbi:MAG TPA: M23 family metallopeptidase [Lacunisphaera sp.]|nr:M23 family metallopeptidase [Lacunisphaera sp.]